METVESREQGQELGPAEEPEDLPDTDESGKSEPGAWMKDIDLSRTVENVLVGIILFFARYPATFFLFLLYPRPLERELIFNASYKNATQVRFTRPVTFLVVSGFIYLGFMLTTVGTFIPIESIVEKFKWLIDRMPKKIEDLTLAKISTFMVPFVLLVALYAYIATLTFRVMGTRVPFKIHLNIACYVAGSFAVLLNISGLVEGPAWDLALGEGSSIVRSFPLLALAPILIGLLGASIFRYVELLRRFSKKGWIRVIVASVTSIIVFQGGVRMGLYFLAPTLEKLQ